MRGTDGQEPHWGRAHGGSWRRPLTGRGPRGEAIPPPPASWREAARWLCGLSLLGDRPSRLTSVQHLCCSSCTPGLVLNTVTPLPQSPPPLPRGGTKNPIIAEEQTRHEEGGDCPGHPAGACGVGTGSNPLCFLLSGDEKTIDTPFLRKVGSRRGSTEASDGARMGFEL